MAKKCQIVTWLFNEYFINLIWIFKVRSLADMVKDFAQLHKLFPDRPKHECFSKFYTSKPQNDGPYVKKTLVAHIEESWMSHNWWLINKYWKESWRPTMTTSSVNFSTWRHNDVILTSWWRHFEIFHNSVLLSLISFGEFLQFSTFSLAPSTRWRHHWPESVRWRYFRCKFCAKMIILYHARIL